MVTGYGLDGPGIEFRWGGEIFRTCPDRPWAVAYPGIFFGGVQQIQLRIEGRENGDLGAVPLNLQMSETRILIRLLWMYFLRNWEFGSALTKLPKFRVNPPRYATGPGAHPASCTMGTVSFLGVERGRDVTLTPYSYLVPRSKNRVEPLAYPGGFKPLPPEIPKF
jgi:hypothetical protein